jgi:hypothetical protein
MQMEICSVPFAITIHAYACCSAGRNMLFVQIWSIPKKKVQCTYPNTRPPSCCALRFPFFCTMQINATSNLLSLGGCYLKALMQDMEVSPLTPSINSAPLVPARPQTPKPGETISLDFDFAGPKVQVDAAWKIRTGDQVSTFTLPSRMIRDLLPTFSSRHHHRLFPPRFRLKPRLSFSLLHQSSEHHSGYVCKDISYKERLECRRSQLCSSGQVFCSY